MLAMYSMPTFRWSTCASSIPCEYGGHSESHAYPVDHTTPLALNLSVAVYQVLVYTSLKVQTYLSEACKALDTDNESVPLLFHVTGTAVPCMLPPRIVTVSPGKNGTTSGVVIVLEGVVR